MVNQAPLAAPKSLKRPKPKWKNKGWWMRQLHTWHYMSAAVALAGILMFAITGITLNHAASIGASPTVVSKQGMLPSPLLPALAHPKSNDAPLPAHVAKAVKAAVGVDPGAHAGEWSDAEVYVALPRPGGDGWVSIDRTTGKITSETTDRGWIAYLNDLHKGRNAGSTWFWLIDVFAIACLVFALTGLVLLQFLAKNRPLTWPLVGLGILAPFLIALFLIH